MSDYMASLDRLIERDDRLLLPGHGGPVTAPRAFLRGLKSHRQMRERAILERLRHGDRSIADMVKAIYRDTDPRLHGAAALSVLAHLEDLVARGLVETDGEPSIDGVFRPVADPASIPRPGLGRAADRARRLPRRRLLRRVRPAATPVSDESRRRVGQESRRCGQHCRRDRARHSATPSACRHRSTCPRRSTGWPRRPERPRTS